MNIFMQNKSIVSMVFRKVSKFHAITLHPMKIIDSYFEGQKNRVCDSVVIAGIILWWRHQMETFSALLALCEGNPPVTGGFPSQRPVTWSFDVSFDLSLNERFSKQCRRRWFGTPSRSLWRHIYHHGALSSWYSHPNSLQNSNGLQWIDLRDEVKLK